MVKVINSGFGGYTQGGPLQISSPSVSAPPTNERFTLGITNYPGLITPTIPDTAPTTAPFWQVNWTRDTAFPGQLSSSRTSSAIYYNSSGYRVLGPSDTPRLEYDPSTGLSQGLLIEEQRTNLFIQSGNLSDAAWSLIHATRGSDSTLALDGTTAIKIIADAASGTAHNFYNTTATTIVSGSTYSVSVHARAGTSSAVFLLLQDGGTGTNNITAIFDLSAVTSGAATETSTKGTATQASANAEYIRDGWFRLTLVGTIPAANCFMEAGIAGATTGNSYTTTGEPVFTGTGTQSAYFDLPQFELGPFSTSPIITAAAAATRSADIVSSTDAGLLAAKGWEIEVGELQTSTAATLLGINTVTALGFDSSNHATTADGGTQTTADTGTLTGWNRAGLAFDSTPRVSIVLDGGTVATAANTPATPTALYFGNTNNGTGGFLNGHIRSIAAYAALADADLDTISAVGAPFTIAATSGTITGAGSSAGAATVTAVGTATAAAVGSSTGSATVTGVGRGISAASGVANGAATVTAVGASTVAGAGSATSSATVTATGTVTKAAAGSSTGSGTATGVGAETAAGAGSSVGSGTATAVGRETAAVTGSSAGAGSASAVGAASEATTGNASGSATVAAVGVGSTVVNFDPTHKSSTITLSGSNLVATGSATGDHMVYGSAPRGAGYYYECKGATGAGIGNRNDNVDSYYNAGGGSDGVGYYSSGEIFGVGEAHTPVASYSATDIIGVAVNLSGTQIDFYKNGVLQRTTTFAPSGSLYPEVEVNASDVATANFGATPLSYIPLGYTSWDGSQIGTATITGTGAASGAATVTAASSVTVRATGTAIGSGAATATGVGASVVQATGTATGTGSASGSGSSIAFVTVQATGLAVGSSTADAVGKANVIHIGKWHVVNIAKTPPPVGAYDDGFSDGFAIDPVAVADKVWKVANAKPQFQTSWHVVNIAKTLPSGGAYDDGFSDGFAIDPVAIADKIWKVAA